MVIPDLKFTITENQAALDVNGKGRHAIRVVVDSGVDDAVFEITTGPDTGGVAFPGMQFGLFATHGPTGEPVQTGLEKDQ